MKALTVLAALLLASTGSQSLADNHSAKLSAAGSDVPSEKKQELEAAPVNSDFITFMNRRNHQSSGKPKKKKKGAFGWVPAPVSITGRLGESRRVARALESLPPSYDLRTLGRVTSVKNQGSWGTCWAFGTYSSMESCLLPGETGDFSEKNLVNLDGFDYGYDYGGHGHMSMAYLCRWGGPVSESDDPYPSGSWSDSSAGLTVRKHAQQIRIIPGKVSATDNAAIKQAVMEHGAILVSYFHDNGYYNSTHRAYYFTGTAAANHGVAVVGWDDNFDGTRFSTPAPTNGAYIVKNSWGTGWGDSGYFYVSYYDTSFARDDMYCFLNAESADNYSNIYQYDPLGWVGSLNAPWAAAIYTATATETLQAVGFYTDGTTTSYSLYVYTGVVADAPRSGIPACSMSGSISSAGFQTLTLTTPAALTNGQRFSVVLQLNGSSYPQAIEYARSGYSSAATAGAGETYGSFDGSSFDDITTAWDSTASFCLKAYTISDDDGDGDGDGIPDWWEARYFGSSSSCIATNDWDLDGHNNLQEFICGTDPTNSASCFGITQCTPLTDLNYFVIEWDSHSGRVYSALWSTNLMNDFQPLETNIEYPRNSCTDTLHSAEVKCFYQVEVQLK